MRIARDRGRWDDRREERAGDERGRPPWPLLVAVEVAVRGRERREVDRRQERLVAGAVVHVRRRHARRPERPAVEAAVERDDPGPAGDAAGELHARRRSPPSPSSGTSRCRSAAGSVSASIRASVTTGSAVADRAGRADQPVGLGVDRRGHPRVVVAERRDRDAVREVEVGPAVGVVEAVALAVVPAPLEVAAEDRREVRRPVRRDRRRR